MKKICFILSFLCFATLCRAVETPFGKITITPHVEDANLDARATKVMNGKLTQVLSATDMSGGFERRFILVPSVDIVSETTTATIPTKVSLRLMVTLSVGDGVADAKFSSCCLEMTGIGDDRSEAICSAIRKINTRHPDLQGMIREAKQKILQYYETVTPDLIIEAKSKMKTGDYEGAIKNLSVIPSVNKDFELSQSLLAKCGEAMIERDNNDLLFKAKAAWVAEPNVNGAVAVKDYLSRISNPSEKVKLESEKLCKEVNRCITEAEKQKVKLEEMKITSRERMVTSGVEAAARLAAGIFGGPMKYCDTKKWH